MTLPLALKHCVGAVCGAMIALALYGIYIVAAPRVAVMFAQPTMHASAFTDGDRERTVDQIVTLVQKKIAP